MALPLSLRVATSRFPSTMELLLLLQIELRDYKSATVLRREENSCIPPDVECLVEAFPLLKT